MINFINKLKYGREWKSQGDEVVQPRIDERAYETLVREQLRESNDPMITNSFRSPHLTTLKSPCSCRGECERIHRDDGFRAGHCDGRVAASNAPRKCPGGKGWIGGGAQASSPSYRRFDSRAEGEKRISLPVVVEVPVGVEREC